MRTIQRASAVARCYLPDLATANTLPRSAFFGTLDNSIFTVVGTTQAAILAIRRWDNREGTATLFTVAFLAFANMRRMTLAEHPAWVSVFCYPLLCCCADRAACLFGSRIFLPTLSPRNAACVRQPKLSGLPANIRFMLADGRSKLAKPERLASVRFVPCLKFRYLFCCPEPVGSNHQSLPFARYALNLKSVNTSVSKVPVSPGCHAN